MHAPVDEPVVHHPHLPVHLLGTSQALLLRIAESLVLLLIL